MKILCPVDGSDFSRFLIQGVGTIFRSRAKEIVLLHVLPVRGPMESSRLEKEESRIQFPPCLKK